VCGRPAISCLNTVNNLLAVNRDGMIYTGVKMHVLKDEIMTVDKRDNNSYCSINERIAEC